MDSRKKLTLFVIGELILGRQMLKKMGKGKCKNFKEQNYFHWLDETTYTSNKYHYSTKIPSSTKKKIHYEYFLHTI